MEASRSMTFPLGIGGSILFEELTLSGKDG